MAAETLSLPPAGSLRSPYRLRVSTHMPVGCGHGPCVCLPVCSAPRGGAGDQVLSLGAGDEGRWQPQPWELQLCI